MNSISLKAQPWPRIIALVDMNAFFASIEQSDRPELRHRPIGVTNGYTGACNITASYEARSYGIHAGMRVRDALQLAPDFIQVASRPYRYAEVSTAIMNGLENISPLMEIFSVDEAFLDLTPCQKLYNCSAAELGQKIKDCVYRSCGLACSVGISGDKSTAKWAAKQQKPDGLTVIEPWRAESALSGVPVTELCGINQGIGSFLARHGVYTCSDMKKIPISVPAARFGNLGRRIWLMAQGLDPEPLQLQVREPKTIGHGKVTPHNTRDYTVVLTFLVHMSEKVAARLRRYGWQAQQFSFAIRTQAGWLSKKLKTGTPTSGGTQICAQARFFLTQWWDGTGVSQVHVAALDPSDKDCQSDLFATVGNGRQQQLMQLMDDINHRYGEFSLYRAALIKRSDMPNVISPSWRPKGHRNTLDH